MGNELNTEKLEEFLAQFGIRKALLICSTGNGLDLLGINVNKMETVGYMEYAKTVEIMASVSGSQKLQ
jgi:hypothetical protein